MKLYKLLALPVFIIYLVISTHVVNNYTNIKYRKFAKLFYAKTKLTNDDLK